MQVNTQIEELAQKVAQAGGDLFVVGGAVRDWKMGKTSIDFDLVICGLSQPKAIEIMENPEKVIKNAPVFVWQGMEVALGRREVSTGQGKHDFQFIADETITIEQDLARRDFTWNGMGWHILDHNLIDPFGGVDDIKAKIVRPISPAFKESFERVPRGLVFGGRFDFDFHPTFIEFAKEMKDGFHVIPKEQIWRHFWKGLKLSVKPSRILWGLRETEWVEFFPELKALIGCPQEPEWHPEGDVWNHTCFVVDECDDPVVRLAAICHDLGKVGTTIFEDGRIKSPRHDKHIEPTISFLDRIGCLEIEIRERVIALVQEHMAHINGANRRIVRRLSKRIKPATIEMLAELVKADHSGRPPLPKEMPKNMADILELAETENLVKNEFKPLVMGRHLIKEFGLKGGKHFGEVLSIVEEAEIDGIFDNLEDGLKFTQGVLIAKGLI